MSVDRTGDMLRYQQRSRLWDYALLWVAVFGVWPLARPPHSFTDPLGLTDLALHVIACGLLVRRAWRGRRQPARPSMDVVVSITAPSDDAPDVIAMGEWTCETCHRHVTLRSTGAFAPTMRTKCWCGTVVEVVAS